MKNAFLLLTLVVLLAGCGAPPTPDAVATQVAVLRAAAATLTSEATPLPPSNTPEPQPSPSPAAEQSTETPAPSATPTAAATSAPTQPPAASPTPLPPTPTPSPEPTQPPAQPTATQASTQPPQPTATQRPPTAVPPPSVAGRMAFSTGGSLHIVQASTGKDVMAPIAGFKQPALRADGDVVIAKGFQGARTSLWTINARSGAFVFEQTTHTDDYHPSWSPDGARFVYDSLHHGMAEYQSLLYIQGLANPSLQPEAVLTYADQPIQGRSPVWMHDDWVAFTGCDYWTGGTGGTKCGIYRMPSWGGRPFLVQPGSLTLRATDNHGAMLLSMSDESGNWEVYLVPSQGGALRNLTDSPKSQDGLGTFSPDGKRVAFVSNRSGRWAVWVVQADGSGLAKLFDLPAPLTDPWTAETLSWGP